MTPVKAWLGICALLAIFTCTLLYADPVAPSQPTKEADTVTASHPQPTYGFRHNPMEFVENDRSLHGARVRTFVFSQPEDGDAALIQKRIDEILAEQREDGSFGDTSKDTGSKLLELLQLGLPHDRAETERAVEALLRQKRAGRNANEWVEEEGALSIYALHALCLLGRRDIPEVQFSLNWYIEHPEEWNAADKGCPWTPEVFWSALWAGREFADTAPTINDGLRRITDGMNAAGCNSYNDPYGFLDAAGQIGSPQARALVDKQIPMILRGQRPDGGWGDHSLAVFRALETHGFLDQLRGLPSLPPDWTIVRSIPAPGASPASVAWDGRSLWVRDTEENRAIAVSPEDGSVVAELDLPVENVVAIGWWDGCLAVTQNTPKKLLKVDPTTGEIKQDITIDETDWTWVGCANAVNGKVWVADEFSPRIIVIDPDNPDDREFEILAGPGPGCFAPTPDGVWHIDFWAKSAIKTSYEGDLLDWGDIPFDVRGLAFDGEHLWALDGETHRLCALEKAAGKEHEQMSTPASDQEGRGGEARVLLDGVVADFKRITNDLESHQVVVGDITYPQPAVYLTTHLVEMWAAGWKEADFDTLAAVSGASALFAYQPDEFMPKYANLHIGMDDRIAGATGFGYEWVPFEDTDSAWPIIKGTIDSGTPLKGWHWENLLIGGYQDAAESADRKVFVMDDGPGTTAEWWTWERFGKWTAEWPHFLGRHTERVEGAPAKEIALRVMSDLVEWSAEPPDAVAQEYPEAKFGLEGIELYAADCADVETYDDWLACHPINPQWTVRNSTAVYLDRVAGAHIFPAHIAEHIAAAARDYRAAYEDWREFYNQLGHDAPENAGKTKERRLAGAAAIRSALEHEKAAIDSLRQALDVAE